MTRPRVMAARQSPAGVLPSGMPEADQSEERHVFNALD